jgi:hypothetical protein
MNQKNNIFVHAGGNGTGQGNETEDEDHEFFDAMEDGASSTDDKAHNSFVMKVPVSISSF